MRAKAHWGVVVALAAPAPTWALGFGDIELFSALSQPFRAEIGLSATAEELESLRVSLADRATFEQSGLERPAFMSNMTFNVTRSADGRNVVSVTSTQAVAEPFVTLIIDAAWTGGRLQREYTVFLDPPVLLNSRQAPAPIAAPQTGGAQPQQSAAPIQRTTPAPAPRQPAPAPRAAAPATPQPAVAPAGAADTYGPVQRSETLWAIAARYQSGGASMNQTMLAIYEANRDAFGGNINSLRVGAILRIPAGSELGAMSAAAANAEVGRQNAAWSGGSAPAPANNAGVSQGERVVLVPPSPDSVSAGGGAANTQAGAAGGAQVDALENELAALRDQIAERDRLIELQSAELADLQDQLSAVPEVDATIEQPAPATTSPGVDIESDAIFADESETAEATEEPAAAAEPAAVTQPEPVATPAADATRTVVSAPAAQPSLLDRIIELATGWIGLVVAGVGAIVIAALLFMRRREEEVEDVTGQWDALEAGMDQANVPTSVGTATAAGGAAGRESDAVEAALGQDPFLVEEQANASSTTLPIEDAEEIAADHYAQATTDDVSTEDTMSTSQVMNLDEADPVAEADFHMAYGLYDQAAELLSKELQSAPDRRDLRLKLLEVFFVWGNKEEFLDTANHLREQMGDQPDSDWDKVLIMGKQICPDAALFAAAASSGAEVDVSLGDTQAGSLDFPFEDSADPDGMDLLDIGEATSADLVADGTIDLDLTGNQPSILSDTSTGLLDATGTLNIGADTAASLEAALFDEAEEHADGATAPIGADDETVLAASPEAVDPASLAVTQESPTLATTPPSATSEETMESPTVEQYSADQPTVESPMFHDDDATQLQATSLTTGDDDYAGGTQELPTIQQSVPGPDSTAEIELNDLGLDVAGIDDAFGIDDIGAELDAEDDTREQFGADDDAGDTREQLGADESTGDTREQRGIDDSGEMLSATGITQVLAEHTAQNKSVDDEQTQLQAGGTLLEEAAVKARAGAETELMESPGVIDDDDFDLDLNDLEAALSDADTVEQPRSVEGLDLGFTTSNEATPIDLDFGEDLIGDDDPTGTEDIRSADPQTLTEVGTKLDLARAYIDMGDPDGARSILEEVLSEGDTTQRSEAQNLIDAIGV